MKKIIRKLPALLLALSLLAAMCIPASAADEITRIEDLLKKSTWYIAGGDAGTVTVEKGSTDPLELKTSQAGGIMAGYYDNVKVGDGKIRFKLQLNRNPLWTAIMFRISGDPVDAVPFYDSRYDKYALLIDGDGVLFLSSWKTHSQKQVNLADGVPYLFDDGEAHQVEIDTQNLSDSKVQIKVSVDGKLVIDMVDNGDVELYGGPAITGAGRIGVHSYQGVASPLGPDMIISAAGDGAPVVNDPPATTNQPTTNAPTTESTQSQAISTATQAHNASTTTSAVSQTGNNGEEKPNNGWVVWVIIGAVVVVGAAGVGIFLVMKKKKSA